MCLYIPAIHLHSNHDFDYIPLLPFSIYKCLFRLCREDTAAVELDFFKTGPTRRFNYNTLRTNQNVLKIITSLCSEQYKNTVKSKLLGDVVEGEIALKVVGLKCNLSSILLLLTG